MNMPPQYMCRRDDIPAIIFAPKTIEKFRIYWSLFTQLRQNLVDLSIDGIKVVHKGTEERMKVKLHAVAGDNQFQNVCYGLTSQFR